MTCYTLTVTKDGINFVPYNFRRDNYTHKVEIRDSWSSYLVGSTILFRLVELAYFNGNYHRELQTV